MLTITALITSSHYKLESWAMYSLLINQVWSLYRNVFVWGFCPDLVTKEQGLCGKNWGQIISCAGKTNTVNKEFIAWLLVPSLLLTIFLVHELETLVDFVVFTYDFTFFAFLVSSGFQLKIVVKKILLLFW